MDSVPRNRNLALSATPFCPQFSGTRDFGSTEGGLLGKLSHLLRGSCYKCRDFTVVLIVRNDSGILPHELGGWIPKSHPLRPDCPKETDLRQEYLDTCGAELVLVGPLASRAS